AHNITYDYACGLKSESAANVADLQFHPVESRSICLGRLASLTLGRATRDPRHLPARARGAYRDGLATGHSPGTAPGGRGGSRLLLRFLCLGPLSRGFGFLRRRALVLHLADHLAGFRVDIDFVNTGLASRLHVHRVDESPVLAL